MCKNTKKLAKEMRRMEDNFHRMITDLTGDLLYCNRTMEEMNQHHINEKGRLSGRVTDLEDTISLLFKRIEALENPKDPEPEVEDMWNIDPMPHRYPAGQFPVENSVIPPEGIDMQMFNRDYPGKNYKDIFPDNAMPWFSALPESFPVDEFTEYGKDQTMYAAFIANAVFFGYGEPSKQEWEDRGRMINILSDIEYDDLQFLMMVWADGLEQGKTNMFVDSIFSRYEAELVDKRGSGPKRTLEQKYADQELNRTYNHNGENDG